MEKKRGRKRKQLRPQQFKKGNTAKKRKTDAFTDAPETKIVRPSQSVMEACMDQNVNSPMILRPRKVQREERKDDTYNMEENLLLNQQCVPTLCAAILEHGWVCKNPDIRACIDQRDGIAVYVTLTCANCRYKKISINFQPKEDKKRKNESHSINMRLTLPCLKTKCGPSDVRFVLAAMNITPPKLTLMHYNLNKACNTMVAVNEISMLQNQQFVEKVQELQGNKKTVFIESDTSYNNRLQAGFETSTMSITPAVECSTAKKLVLALSVSSKICTKSNCDHNNPACSRNYREDQSLSSCEGINTVANVQKINTLGHVQVTDVITDANRQVEKCLRDHSARTGRPIKHHLCMVHRFRTLQKRIKALRLTSTLTDTSHDTFSQRVASFIRQRLYREFKAIQQLPSTSAENRRIPIMKNAVHCMQGNHSGCRRNSLVCEAHMKSPMFNSNGYRIPPSQSLRLIPLDRVRLQQEILTFFTPENIEKLKTGKNTNKVESVHHRCFVYAPKNTNYATNFPAMCHSAVHSDTHHTGKSCILLSKMLGIHDISSPFVQFMKLVDKKQIYDKARQRSKQFKFSRHISRKRKFYRRYIGNSLYRSGSNVSTNDHSYGINLNQ